jgi:signal transduction histidine kinase
MSRIRIVFVALGLLLLVPMVLLVRSALRSTNFELAARHRALAERAGDEIERELTRIIQEEEARPFGHYRFYYVPSNVAGGRYGLLRSPLADAPTAPYVVGYFEIQPDGTIHTPRIPLAPELARERGDWQGPPTDGRIARMREVILHGLEAARARQGQGMPQAPGTTAASGLAAAADAGQQPETDAYRALLALNRGANQRAKAGVTRLNIQLSPLEDGSGLRVTTLQEGREEPLAESALRFAAATGREELWFDPAAVLDDRVPRPRKVYVHPFTGSLEGSEHLILMRAAASEGKWFWQGAVLDVQALTRFVDESVFGGSEVASRLRRDYFVQHGPEPPPLESQVDFVFVHRFARPFESVAVRMAIAPFSDLGGLAYVYVLALLVLLSASAGLYALYRTVSVTVGFAERRSNFAAAVSHELKTPLTAIRMYAEMLRDGMVDSEEKRREYADTITTESERLTRLINNVLEFSRLEQGTREVSLVPGPLGPVVEEAARILRPHAQQAGFELRVQVEEGLPEVRYDRDAVLQVVFNLVDNALKYAQGARDRSVELSLRRAEGGVALGVRDRGPGVPSQHLSKVFEAFYRGEDELTRTTKGTGIGLALVRGLAERMGAAVSARNAAGGGFAVVLRFPAPA